MVYSSLFKDSKNYRKVVEALSEKKKGLSREEIKEATHIKEGGTLTEILSNLAQCDFIREYNAIGKEQRDSLFQLTDLFTLFYLNFVQKGSGQTLPLLAIRTHGLDILLNKCASII